MKIANEAQDVVIAVTVTDRVESLSRLLASIEPIADDRAVHVLVVDNGRDHSAELNRLMQRAQRDAAGQRVLHRAKAPRSPLHVARREISEKVAELSGRIWSASPMVWIVDDDIAFEKVHFDDGQLRITNIASRRIAELRAFAARDECDLLVSGFTGDPPARPNASLASQAGDLEAELRRLAGMMPGDRYSAPADLDAYTGDYYYDHAEPSNVTGRRRYPWLPRHGHGQTVADQTRLMLQAARGISVGQTPFRPLVPLSEDTSLAVPDSAPNRGGNAVFFSMEALQQHPYPSFEVLGGWSRRADMIGTALLGHEGQFRIYRGHLTLRHDRTGQSTVGGDPTQWVPEFAGVMLARLVMRGPPSDRSVTAHLNQLATERADCIVESLRDGVFATQAAHRALHHQSAFWWTHRECRLAALHLSDSLRSLEHTLRTAYHPRLRESLLDQDLHRAILDVWEALRCQAAA